MAWCAGAVFRWHRWHNRKSDRTAPCRPLVLGAYRRLKRCRWHTSNTNNEKGLIVKTRRILSLVVLATVLASNSAHAFFFFFIPGSVTDKIADAFTGSEGDNCVGPQVKVGDNIKLPSGGIASVKSLSGTSSRCTQPEFPIRALLGTVDRASIANVPGGGIELPEGWAPMPLNASLKAKGIFFYASNTTIDASMILSAVPGSRVTDIAEFVKARRNAQISNLNDAHATETEQLIVHGMPAWRFEVRGISRVTGNDVTFLGTIIDADVVGRGRTLIFVNSWIASPSYPEYKDVLSNLPDSLAGMNSQRLTQSH